MQPDKSSTVSANWSNGAVLAVLTAPVRSLLADETRLKASTINLAATATLTLLPLFLLQGRYVQKRTPLLRPAAGSTTGVTAGKGAPFRLLVIGESTVAGVGAAHHDEALTGQLATVLAQRLGRPVHWEAVGRIGATARAAQLQLVPKISSPTVDKVLIVLGANDVLSFRGARAWKRDLQGLIEALRRRLGPVAVAMAAAPPVNCAPIFPQPLRGALGLRVRALNHAARRLAESATDVMYITTELTPEPDYFCHDRFHPSPVGYAAWAKHLGAAIVARFFMDGDQRPELEHSPRQRGELVSAPPFSGACHHPSVIEE